MRTACCIAIALLAAHRASSAELPRIPASTHNLLVDAKTSGNLESYDKGLRGASDHMIYDPQVRRFIKRSRHAEYGVDMNQDLGILPEDRPAWWMAEWPEPVSANLIVLSGVYPNQPQPNTAWKIELRRNGQWTTHARGVGGWYDRKRYVWGGREAEPIRFDALRVSLFSKDDRTPIKSIHFRGEEGISWIVASLSPIDARVILPRTAIRAGQKARLSAQPVLGDIKSWTWIFPDGTKTTGRQITHTFGKPGSCEVTLDFSTDEHSAQLKEIVMVSPPIEARITPLTGPVMAGRPVQFAGARSIGEIKDYSWDFGDGSTATGQSAEHTFAKPGIYKVTLTVTGGQYTDECLALVRAHTDETLHVPQVLLDTDQKNEVDDQHYTAYAVFGELDVLGENSIHHGGGQEEVNYKEILHILDLAKQSGAPDERIPFVFRGSDQPLPVPKSAVWSDTRFAPTEASDAILAAARGASPSNPVWIVPVGPGTNMACAVLQARVEGLELKDRLRVMWLGGSNDAITGEFNGNNDPWGTYVVAHSGLETWILPAPVGGRVRMDKRTEGDLYAENILGQYLREITPARSKSLFDPACLSAIISERLGLGWVKETEPITVAGPDDGYKWIKTDDPTPVLVIREIDQEAMKTDIFDTMKGKATPLIGVPPR